MFKNILTKDECIEITIQAIGDLKFKKYNNLDNDILQLIFHVEHLAYRYGIDKSNFQSSIKDCKQ